MQIYDAHAYRAAYVPRVDTEQKTKFDDATIDRVLEIIDSAELIDPQGDAFEHGFDTAKNAIHRAVMALKGEKEET